MPLERALSSDLFQGAPFHGVAQSIQSLDDRVHVARPGEERGVGADELGHVATIRHDGGAAAAEGLHEGDRNEFGLRVQREDVDLPEEAGRVEDASAGEEPVGTSHALLERRVSRAVTDHHQGGGTTGRVPALDGFDEHVVTLAGLGAHEGADEPASASAS